MSTLSSFSALSQGEKYWYGCCVLGDDTFSSEGKRIYKQSGGVGGFVLTFTIEYNGYGISDLIEHNGDLYACLAENAGNGAIYKIPNGTSTPELFRELPTQNLVWMTFRGDDIYVCQYYGYIWKQTGGVGDFVAISTSKTWQGIRSIGSDVFSCKTYDGSVGVVYKQTGGVGDFVNISNTFLAYLTALTSFNNDLYIVESYGSGARKIYKLPNGVWSGSYISNTLNAEITALAFKSSYVYATCRLAFDNSDIYKARFLPGITLINPELQVEYRDLLTITGTDLEGVSTTEITIDSVDYTANIISASPTEITFTAPDIALWTHDLKVIADSFESNAYEISYIPLPKIKHKWNFEKNTNDDVGVNHGTLTGTYGADGV